MLATALTVVLGTAPVTAFAADVDSTVTEAEQTTPQADTTVKEEVAEPEVKAITVDVTTSSTTFDGTQDIVITYTVNGVQDGFEPYQDIPWFDGHPQDVIEEKVSDTVYKFTITKAAQQACIERNNATDGQIFVFDSKYSTGSVDFPTVTLTYTTGDNGGSILSHDHFQGGHYTFAMEKAPVIQKFTVKGFEDVTAGIVKWPLSVIRLQSEDVTRVIDLADHILQAWRGYTDEAAFIFAETDGQPHNTITPIARMRDGKYELDLTLRNNITTEEHPLGVYHPHKELHHIKKENIGLIEVMGLAVLPARLKDELELLKTYILEKKDIRSNETIAKHADWTESFLPSYPEINAENVTHILEQEVGKVFCQVLEDAGVYKCTDEGLAAFDRFVETL